MANTKIPSELSSTPSISDSGNATAITIDSSENVALSNDLTVDGATLVVDASENKVGINRSTPTAPLDVSGEAKISGDLTVDTSTLKVDSTNNRVGIGTTSPTVPLHISSTGHTQYKQHRQSSSVGTGQEMKFAFDTADGTEEVYGSIYTDIKANTDGAESGNIALRVADAGSLGYVIHGAGGGDTKLYADGATVMTLKDGGSVGVGTDSPSNQFTIYRSGTETTASIHSNGQSELRFVANNAANTWIQAGTGPSSSQVPMYLTGMYGTNNTMTIDSANARVGIGTTSPAKKLHVAGNIRLTGNGTDASRWSVFWNGSVGDLILVNNLSDERIKEDFDYNIRGLETVKKLKPLKFSWKDGKNHSKSVSGRARQYGFIAQDTMKADEYLAWHREDEDEWGIEEYESFAAVLTKAIQEQQTIIDDLKERIETLENA